MDLHHYFGAASSSRSDSATFSNSEDSDSDIESLEKPGPSKKHCSGKSSQRKYNKKWEKD